MKGERGKMFEELEKKSLSEIAKEAGYFTREKIEDKKLNIFLENFINLIKVIRKDFEEEYFLEEAAIYDERIYYLE